MYGQIIAVKLLLIDGLNGRGLQAVELWNPAVTVFVVLSNIIFFYPLSLLHHCIMYYLTTVMHPPLAPLISYTLTRTDDVQYTKQRVTE